MYLRRLLLVPFLVLIVASGSASAASWHTFSSKSLGFAVQYPNGWKALSTAQPGASQVQFSYQGSTTYTVNVTVLSLNGGKSLNVLKKRFLAFQRRAGNTNVAAMHWGTVTLGGRRGIGGVYIPATEGGVSVANGTYVIPWKSRTYMVSLLSVQKPAPHTLNKFPAIYQQILKTWRFR
jgi:hypothetical protein